MKLSKREKFAVSLAAVFLILFIVIRFVVSPHIEKKDRLERSILTKRGELRQMAELKTEYNYLKKKAELSKMKFEKKRDPGFTLFSFLDKLAGETELKDHIKYMKPSKTDIKDSPYKLSQVEMKLQGINLKQLTPYLHKIETSKNNVFIKRISIRKKGKGEGFIDVVLQVETFEK